MRTKAGMPPDLKMESRPSLWWDRLWRMLAVARAVSMSLVFCMARTTAATIWGDCISARRDASLRVSWLTICAALLTTTWWEIIREKTSCLLVEVLNAYFKKGLSGFNVISITEGNIDGKFKRKASNKPQIFNLQCSCNNNIVASRC